MRRRHRSYHASRGATGAQDASHGAHAASAGVSGTTDATSSASAASGGSVSAAGGSTIHGNVNVHLDLNASALSVDATGAVAVLAGRKGLHLVALDAPFLPPATLHHQTKLEVTVVKCNPHALFKSHVASSSNRNTLIWDIADVGVGSGASASIGAGQGSSSAYKHGHGGGAGGAGGSGSQTATQPLVATLRAHTRPVSDVAWSPMEPSLLATCSADAKTLLWDMRSPQRPVQTLNAFNTSVIQVEWNRVDATSLATAHDGEVRVWDLRAAGEKTVAPAVQITAHMQKIYGLDWHPQRMYELLTCSDDKTVKFWDVTQPRVCQGTLNTGAPVWRAQYTPFGDGLVTISSQRMDNSIRLWALSHGDGDSGGNEDAGDVSITGTNAGSSVTAELVHSFAGHSDLVRGMAWRVRPQTSVYQLVSWSKDQELRMWHVDVPQLEACGYDTASYLADVAPSEGNNTNARRQSDARRMLHAEFAEMHAQHSKYSLSALKTDFVPLVVPKSAVPLGTDEYTLEGNDSSLQALMALEEELIKGGETESQPASGEEDGPVSGTGDKDDARSDDSAGDVQALASIVCALKPNERKDPEEIRGSVTLSAITMEDQLPVLSFRSVNDEKCLLSSLPEDEARYDIYKEAYADVLYRYGAMNLRNEVLKTKSHGVQDPRGISMGLICGSCNARTIDPVCSSCRDFAVRCSVCQLVVRGQSMFCMTCGHGGHAAHLREWFEVETACPTGCGCWCKQATATMPAFQLEQQEADHTVAPSRSHSF
ncbi:Conserved WD40 repeat-containing protein [Phytophthora cinnamomi]|uniref:Conserved WD40 repeat-containing protein n=1 Tax=Phytophthora cinnamomi TaxID=4785 RepID=UPI00355AABAA|nr:Conserved WD40 repeat-containing protein [Phytophthora cinnamomi]